MLPPDRTVKKKNTVLSGGIIMPQRVKATAEEKLQIVEQYLSGKIGPSEATRRANVGETTFRRWVSRYKAEGAIGLVPQERNRAYSKELKLAAVLDYLAGKGSMSEICEQYKIRHSQQLRNWLKVYHRHGDFTTQTGGSHMTMSRDTLLEERIEIVKACIANGNDYGGTALKYQVSYQQVYTWVKKYRAMGEAGLEDRRGHRTGTLPSRTQEEELRDRIAQLERKNFDLEMENAVLKKLKELGRRRR
jgi:transposase-like protein